MKIALLIFTCCLSCFLSFAQIDTTLFYTQAATGALNDNRLNEISGIADCRGRNGFFWMHNDSGDSARFFLVSREGAVERRVYFPESVFDCEDMAVGLGAKPGTYLYLGDMGDNFLFRSTINIYVFREDSLLMGSDQNITATKYRKISLRYPDGAHDAEALAVDPLDSTLYIITKSDAKAIIFGIPLKKLFKGGSFTLKKFGVIPHTKFTAADISLTGQEIVLKRTDSIFYWKRPAGTTFSQTLKTQPYIIPYNKEKQGEAVCFAADGSGFYTASEGVNEPIFFFKKKESAAKQAAFITFNSR